MYAEICLVLVAIVEISSRRHTTQCIDLRQHRHFRLLNRDLDCGPVAEPLSPRVLGGKKAELAEFPWMARLMYSLNEGGFYGSCGGTVINDRYILSAAHCSTIPNGTLAFVRLGEYDSSTLRDCDNGRCAPGVVDIPVEEIIPHSKYTKPTSKNDICLVRLAKKIVFNEFIYPVCLPLDCRLQTANFVGVPMTAAGWGRLDNVPRPRWPTLIQKLTLPVVDMRKCSMERGEPLDDSQLCAGGVLGHDVCKGDSGGPLMLLDSHHDLSRYYAIGVVSYGQTCSSRDTNLKPGVYTRVSSYIPWILDHIYE